jgi:dTDP-4-dehydrorhamnose reductase
MTKILLFGSAGQVGRELNNTLKDVGTVIECNRNTVNLEDNQQIKNIIQQIKPDLIVNSAAYTAVDKAESEPQLAEQINAIAPKIMAEESEKINSKLIHISTDYVFNGEKNQPYLETDKTNPLGVYGQTKLAGEENIKNTSSDYLILRTAWVYGTYGKGNFVKTMLRLAQEKEQLNIVIDQIGSPTYAQDIAQTIKLIIPSILSQKIVRETYHFTNLGVCSWYDFTVNIIEEAKKLDYPIKLKQILPILTSEYPTPAKRPHYSVLSTKKLINDFQIIPNYWQTSLKIMLDKYINK